MRALLALIISGAWLLTGAAAEQSIIIHAGTLLAVPGEKPLHEQSIIVSGGRIVELRQGYVGAAEIGEHQPRIVDLSRGFVLPGLIDCHVHITFEREPRIPMKLALVTQTDADQALAGAAYARRTLLAGFTTVRSLGSSGYAAFALRDAIRDGKVPGPRILAAGHIIGATGGHGDFTLGLREDVAAVLADSGRCDGAVACRRAVRVQVQRGADVIKFAATGGVLSDVRSGTGQQLTNAEMKSIVATAHALGRKVAAHAHGSDGVNAALRAGVDSIEHGSMLNKTSIKLFRDSGAYLVPTLLAPATILKEARSDDSLAPAVRQKALAIGTAPYDAIRLAIENDVKIAFGTDSGVSRHGRNAEEFALLTEAGMEPADAIRAATVNAADLLGLSSEVGTIEAGKAADIIAVARNPLRNVKTLTRVRFVMHDGRIFKNQPLE